MRSFLIVAALAIVVTHSAPAAEGKIFGKGVGAANLVKVSELVAHPEQYVGKPVRVEGIVVDVCAKRGCWMDIKGDGGTMRIKVEDGVMVFPMEAKGKRAVAEGVFTKIEMTPDEARAMAKHQAEERGQDPGKSETADAPTVVYQIAGTGAVVN